MRAASRKYTALVLGLLLLGYVVYRAKSIFHFGDFSGAKLLEILGHANLSYLLLSLIAIYACYALRALRWKVFQQNLGPSHFWRIYRITLAGFSAVFLLGRAGEPVRPLLLAGKEKLPVADMFGIYVLERLFDTASTAVIAAIGLILFESHVHTGETSGKLEAAARTTGALLFAGVLVAMAGLIYLRVHGTALLERRLQGWLGAGGWRGAVARIVLGFARGVQTIRTGRDLFLALFYSAAHWFLIVLIYFWISRSLGGQLGTLSLSDSMLVLAFTLVGSTVQLPGVGGGSQAGSIIAYTAIFGLEREPAVAAAIVLWLITFASCSLAGVPLLIREGWSLGDLKRMAEKEKQEELDSLVASHIPDGKPMIPVDQSKNRQGESSE